MPSSGDCDNRLAQLRSSEAKVDNQVAASAGTRTLNWHRAKKTLIKVRMEGCGSGTDSAQRSEKPYATKIRLTGLLMEGDYTQPLLGHFE